MRDRPTTILLTGSTGLVGSAVARELLATGHHVVALVRSAHKGRDLAAAGARLAVGDMLDPTTYRPLVDEVDAVVHTAQYATSGRYTNKAAARIRAADHVMTAALVDGCLGAGKRFVYTGGCFNYGDHGHEWITEDTPFRPSPLGVGHASEITTLRERRQQGLDVIVISPGFVYGPGGLFKTSFFDQAQAGRLRCIGRGDNYWSTIHVDDLATAFVAALDRARMSRSS